jgi:Lipocalin-like domain
MHPGQNMNDPSQLIGTWRMLTWHREFADTGERVDALGADPVGFISYGADGRVNALVVRRDRPSPASLPPSSREKIELFDSMLAYAGTYTLHDDHVVHHLDASWNEAWTGTDQIRFYNLDSSKLEIWGAPAPDPYTGRTVVHRITFEKWPGPRG